MHLDHRDRELLLVAGAVITVLLAAITGIVTGDAKVVAGVAAVWLATCGVIRQARNDRDSGGP